MIAELLFQMVTFLVITIGSWGYIGIVLLMMIESTFIPFPSELVLIPAGVLIAKGEMSWAGVILYATFGSWLGATINYLLARELGKRMTNRFLLDHKRVFFISKNNLLKAEKYFKKHGDITIFIGRLIPVIRQLISLPAGFARMNFFKFSLFTSFGALVWIVVLAYLGYFYDTNLELLHQNIKALTWIVLGFVSLLVLIYVLWRRKANNNKT